MRTVRCGVKDEDEKSYLYYKKIGTDLDSVYSKRVNKSSLMKVQTKLENVLSGEGSALSFYVFCLPEREQAAYSMARTAVLDKLSSISEEVHTLQSMLNNYYKTH